MKKITRPSQHPMAGDVLRVIMANPRGRKLPDLGKMLDPIITGAALSLSVKPEATAQVTQVGGKFAVRSRRRLLTGMRIAHDFLREQMIKEGISDFELTQQQMNHHLVTFVRAVKVS